MKHLFIGVSSVWLCGVDSGPGSVASDGFSLRLKGAADLRLTECLRAELASSAVQVIEVLPRLIETPMSRDFPGAKADPEDIAK